MKEELKTASQTMGYNYVLPDGKRILPISGSAGFIRDMLEMLNLMVHSPTALKILNHNADLPKPLVIEEWENALDLGRNEKGRLQIASGRLADGSVADKYDWLQLVPHEFRHSYNMRSKSTILQSVAYGIANEPDAKAMEGVIAMELTEYLKRENVPGTDTIQKRLESHPTAQMFMSFYDESKGTDEERKAAAVIRFSQAWASQIWPDPRYGHKTAAETAYRIGIERDISPDGGWVRLADEDFKKVEADLLKKEGAIIREEWPTFCQRLMDGTYNTDVLPYGQNIKPEKLIETISPKLAAHLKEIGVMPKKAEPYLPTPVAER